MSTQASRREAVGLDGPLAEALVSTRRFFTKATVSEDGRTLQRVGGRGGDSFYRDRWSHDKVVRSHPRRQLHRVLLVEGLRQGRDHHLGGPADRLPVAPAPTARSTSPAAAPAARPSPGTPTRPTRVRYPYVRGVLLDMYREAKAAVRRPGPRLGLDRAGPARRRQRYKSARGKGGLVRATLGRGRRDRRRRARLHDQALGPRPHRRLLPDPGHVDGLATPPASRFTELIGGAMLSFYDWYADLPVASPQMFGDQTDVPESGDWWDAGYLIMWGSNVPLTRTPDAHWMTEARYRGQKVVVMSPDYAENVKFADEWLPVAPGTDAALGDGDGARHPQGVLRRPAGRRSSPTTARRTPTCPSWWRSTHARLPGRRQDLRPGQVPRRRRPRRCLGEAATSENAMWKPAMIDAATERGRHPERLARRPLRRGGRRASGTSTWATSSRALTPARRAGRRDRRGRSCRASTPSTARSPTLRRGVPVRRVGDRAGHHRVRPDARAVRRRPRRGCRARGRPATTTPTRRTPRPGRRTSPPSRPAAGRADRPRVRAERRRLAAAASMILMGAGTNHWYHSDLDLPGDARAHHDHRAARAATAAAGRTTSGQEKIRPIIRLPAHGVRASTGTARRGT